MSTKNIVDISFSGLSVRVTFSVHGAQGTRTYEYFDLEAVRGILAGEDPSQWLGVQVDGDDSGAGGIGGGIGDAAEGIGSDIAADIGDIGAALL